MEKTYVSRRRPERKNKAKERPAMSLDIFRNFLKNRRIRRDLPNNELSLWRERISGRIRRGGRDG